jgi:alkylation response protein AidB-like acyl-CoA dehydrogenase
LAAKWRQILYQRLALCPLVPTRAEGVEILDDWDGFGQTLSASGTALFKNVVISDDLINPAQVRFRYANGFFQTVHLATLAGIGRAAANDLSRLVAERRRIYSNGNAARVAEDPQVLQVVGKVRAAAYGAGAIALKTADALQRVHAALLAGDAEAADRANVAADIEVSQAVTVITDLVLGATTILFDALGASAAKRSVGLDRHWRNARTIASHNPRIYRERAVGDFSVNGTKPEVLHRAGLPDSPAAIRTPQG